MNHTDHIARNIEQIGSILGKDISVSHAGDVATFSDFCDADLAEFRMLDQLSSVLTLFYIRFRLKERATLPQAVSFRSEVLHSGTPVQEWRHG